MLSITPKFHPSLLHLIAISSNPGILPLLNTKIPFNIYNNLAIAASSLFPILRSSIPRISWQELPGKVYLLIKAAIIKSNSKLSCLDSTLANTSKTETVIL
jgi:hypothetical protein